MIDILVVDDHPVIGLACRLLLEGVGNVLAAQNAEDAYQAVLQRRPDVIIMDLSLQSDKLAGIALIERIRLHDPDAKILVFSMDTDISALVSAMEAGASGYLAKDAPSDELTKAVHKVGSGLRYIDPQLALKLAFPNTGLTDRERQVLALLTEGTSYASIADQLGVNHRTVLSLRARVKRKLDARGPFIVISSDPN